MKIELTVNGRPFRIDCEPTRKLLDILREDCGLAGVKEGCGEGECGACAVLVDGSLKNSCLLAAGQVADATIVTIDGFRETERFAILEEAFGETGGVQCGFCTPGMIMACEALLSRNSDPDEMEIRRALEGNLCRCTGYNMIIRAVRTAAQNGKGLWG